MNPASSQAGPPDPAQAPSDGEPAPDGWLDDEALAEAAAPVLDDAAANASRAGLAAPVTEAQLAAWIEAIIDRDERALACLYDATCCRVMGVVLRIVRRNALAEEVVEDTYFQVWRQAPRFDPARGSALTWLLAMARSRAIDAWRREARFQHESLDAEDGGTVPTEQAAPSDDLLDVARHHAQLHRALMDLGAQPRQLVSLAFFRGLSHEEIASQTCLPLGTVKSQIRRALASLRQALGDAGLGAFAS